MCPIICIMNMPPAIMLVSAVSVMIGLFVFLKPERTIEIQRKFYAMFNWRLEPISMPKEIRNTKIMGIFLVAAAVANLILGQ